jgi:hypothetical protein
MDFLKWLIVIAVEYLMKHFGKASVVSSDVEMITGRKPVSFEQFAEDYADAFR